MGEQELAVMFRGFPGLHFHEHTIACMRTWNFDELRAHAKQRPLALTHVWGNAVVPPGPAADLFEWPVLKGSRFLAWRRTWSRSWARFGFDPIDVKKTKFLMSILQLLSSTSLYQIWNSRCFGFNQNLTLTRFAIEAPGCTLGIMLGWHPPAF